MRLRAAALAAALALGACTGGTTVPGDPANAPETSFEPVPALFGPAKTVCHL
jgi:ABC-type glycerol-3-phosphate transport system substrate-binding protein